MDKLIKSKLLPAVMRFAHMADCHIGGWSDPKMKQLSLEAFERAMYLCMEKKVDFVLISGDLFNTALPQIDLIKETVRIMKEVKDKGIGIFVIAGSHDFSPSGKTMLDVFEKAGLCENVVKLDDNRLKFTEKDGAKIAGPVPLPTSKKKYSVNRSTFVHKDARDQYEIRVHKRLIDIVQSTPRTVDMLMSLNLPAGVDVSMKTD